MRKITEVVLFAALIIVAALMPARPAHAQLAATTYVASNGVDSQTCQRADPCQTFTKAISVTAAGGAVRCVDQLGVFSVFQTVTISQSIVIDCKGIGGAVQRETADLFGTGFIINGAGIDVTLRGLNIGGVEGGTFGPGHIGIDIRQAASVHIEDCTIRGFGTSPAQGIRLATTSGAVNLTVIDTIISKNGLGIRILPSGGAALVSLLRVQMYGNSSSGFEATSAGGGAVFGNIVDSTANGNGVNGFSALSFSGGKAVVLDIQHSNASLNAQSGILADGPASSITIGASMVTSNGTGFGRANGGALLSYGNNNVDNNSVAGSASGSAGQM